MVYTMATVSGGGITLAAFILSLSQLPVVDDLGDVLFGLALCSWAGFPLVVLGQVKVYRGFPRFSLALWAAGLAVLVGLLYAVFFAARSSTSALGLITVPLFVVLVYAVTGLALKTLVRDNRRLADRVPAPPDASKSNGLTH
jgi:hypothetical protein